VTLPLDNLPAVLTVEEFADQMKVSSGSASFPATFRRHRAVRPGTNVPVGMTARFRCLRCSHAWGL